MNFKTTVVLIVLLAVYTGSVNGRFFTELNLQGTCGLIACDFRLAAFDQFFLTSTPTGCDDDTNGQGNEDPGCQGEDES